MDEKYEVNYAGTIYKSGDQIKFEDEADTIWIGVVRFGLYSTLWMNSDTHKIHRNEHLGWIVDYNVIKEDDGESWCSSQKTLVDVISKFGGVLLND